MEISRLSVGDYALLEATYTHYNDKNFQCRKKEQEIMNLHGDAEAVIKEIRTEKGCGIMNPEPVITFDSGIAFRSCLCHPNFQHPEYIFYFTCYKQMKNGILPFPGGLIDQPNKVMEAVQYLDALVSDQMEQEHNKQMEELNRKKAKLNG